MKIIIDIFQQQLEQIQRNRRLHRISLWIFLGGTALSTLILAAVMHQYHSLPDLGTLVEQLTGDQK